jgi:hypothetical protein
LRPLTEALDRGTRWAHYRTIPSLREYVLISQDEVSIKRYVRDGDRWVYSTISDPDGIPTRITASIIPPALRGSFATRSARIRRAAATLDYYLLKT